MTEKELRLLNEKKMAEAEEIHEESVPDQNGAKEEGEGDSGEKSRSRPPTPEPAYKRFIKPTMVNKCASRFNRKLHRLFLSKNLEECSLLIEVSRKWDA